MRTSSLLLSILLLVAVAMAVGCASPGVRVVAQPGDFAVIEVKLQG